VDRLRPKNVSFQAVMEQRLNKASPIISPNTAVLSLKSNTVLVSADKAPTWNENVESNQVNALYSLLENRYATESPMPDSLRKPASNPTYYDDLIQEMQDAPTRSWLGGLWRRIQGSFRLT